MNTITRRDYLAVGAGALAAATLPGHGTRSAVAAADVAPPKYPIEQDAMLRVARPIKFVGRVEDWRVGSVIVS